MCARACLQQARSAVGFCLVGYQRPMPVEGRSTGRSITASYLRVACRMLYAARGCLACCMLRTVYVALAGCMSCVVRSALHEWHHYSRSSRHRFVTDSDHSRCMRHVVVDLMNVARCLSLVPCFGARCQCVLLSPGTGRPTTAGSVIGAQLPPAMLRCNLRTGRMKRAPFQC